MPHLIGPATSGRSRCRGCGAVIAREVLRLGERLPSPYADDGDMTIWYHLKCAAYRRPEALLEGLAAAGDVDVDERAVLERLARFSLSHRRVARIAGLERASSGRARCRSCRTLIDSKTLRIPLVFHEEGIYTPGGFVHLACAADYFGSRELLDCVRHFATGLADADLREITGVLA